MQLPLELHIKIFHHVEDWRDLLTLSRVCSAFRHLLTNQQKSIFLHNAQHTTIPELLQLLDLQRPGEFGASFFYVRRLREAIDAVRVRRNMPISFLRNCPRAIRSSVWENSLCVKSRMLLHPQPNHYSWNELRQLQIFRDAIEESIQFICTPTGIWRERGPELETCVSWSSEYKKGFANTMICFMNSHLARYARCQSIDEADRIVEKWGNTDDPYIWESETADLDNLICDFSFAATLSTGELLWVLFIMKNWFLGRGHFREHRGWGVYLYYFIIDRLELVFKSDGVVTAYQMRVQFQEAGLAGKAISLENISPTAIQMKLNALKELNKRLVQRGVSLDADRGVDALPRFEYKKVLIRTATRFKTRKLLLCNKQRNFKGIETKLTIS